MDISMSTLLSSGLILALISCVFSVPIDMARETEGDQHLEDKRPKYMDTRDLDRFQRIIYLALKGLVEEGKLNPDVMATPTESYSDDENEKESKDKISTDKRGHLRICVRRSGSRYVPYPCFRG
ncbi:uncharacterized protein LOC125665991 [Ostrea edulis]|uniref:uncharacterized protein LOC125665991 n=1 Tax=Ostrea edulis TaxID=37623 RepID=UPI0020959D63|nr:uncharacterized protein LOC125665991 [Ostrea edulis]